ncbi:MAG: restriction endonuclease [Planctomycetota bacterium]|nr:restriction endonuclease [Planctomycetota bacterium]
MSERQVVPQKFGTWIEVTQCDESIHQILPISHLGLRLHKSRQANIQHRISSDLCPCCDGNLTDVYHYISSDETNTTTHYDACPLCGYWIYKLTDSLGANHIAVPHSAEFNPHKEAPLLSHLCTSIHEFGESLEAASPRKVEELVGSVLKEFHECNVSHVGRSDDGRTDLFVIEKDEPLLIQISRCRHQVPVLSVDVVKLLFVSVAVQGGDKGRAVTTAQRLNPLPREWVSLPELRDYLFTLDSADINKLLSIVNAVRLTDSGDPWEVHLNREPDSYPFEESSSRTCWRKSDGILIDCRTALNDRLYLFEASVHGYCYELDDGESLRPILAPLNSVRECLAAAADSGHSIRHVDGDNLFSVLATFDERTVSELVYFWWENRSARAFKDLISCWQENRPERVIKKILYSWWKNRPETVVDLMDYYG